MQNDSIFQNLSYLSISLYQIYGNRQNPAIWLTQIALKIIFREYSGPLLPKNRTFTKTPDQCLALSRSYLHIKKSEHIMIQLIKPFGKVYSSKGKFSEAQAHPIFSWLFTNQPKTDQTHPRLTNIYIIGSTASPRPTLGCWQRHKITIPIFITAYYVIWPNGNQEPRNEVGFQGPIEIISEIWARKLWPRERRTVPLFTFQ